MAGGSIPVSSGPVQLGDTRRRGDLAVPPVASAQRELLEETGLVAAEWTPLMEMHLSNSVTDEKAIIFLARQLEQRQPEPEETEQLVVRKVPFAEAYRMVEQGLITDSMSVAAILKVKIMLNEAVIPHHRPAASR